ncbi:MAG: FKBP-type peptidyl-prolyl cis-trans isomerase [Spirochaetaceae bacterium]|jgi:FKBP-type peptidyl-prolyl cis-trans isomerase FkpA/FKBP-type peptidyl-prolyl cis-trans isomerase FklB|nr:FKBP-type peptidyl-prolyl cis-trans isomerase [Spirochaetaceae bacterium]
MKKNLLFIFFACFFTAGVFSADNNSSAIEFDGEISYSMGVVIGAQLAYESLNIEFDRRRFTDGLCDQMASKKMLLDFENVMSTLPDSFEEGKVLDEETSYAVGAALGYYLVESAGFTLKFNKTEFLKGLEAVISEEAVVSVEDASKKVETALMRAVEGQKTVEIEKSKKFMADNGKKSGVITTKSGLQYKVEKRGSGKKPDAESIVTVNYEGRLLDGTVFDSSYERGESAQFQLDEVIQGWSEGIQLMNVGSKFTLYIPPDLGYGDMAGYPIPPNAVLIFEVELIAIE